MFRRRIKGIVLMAALAALMVALAPAAQELIG